ncbi:MAG TPA: dienelactone hydrolase family protein [Candidatus Binatia bacterium]|nr:dienelactone hydrolase family protein [Candidatus Binatia bacterium]
MMATVADLSFPSSTGRPMRAALALPDAPGRRPSVIVIHEIFGLNDDMRRIAGRFADLGWVALAPDLYDTEGPRALCVARAMLALRRKDGPAFADLEAARAWLATRPEVDAERTGVVGFCMGGGFALLWAVRAPLGAAGVFYGDVPATADELRGVCPVVAGYGGRDRLFANQGRRLESQLATLGVPHDVRIYPDAGHSYMSRHEGLLATIAAWGPMKVGFDATAEADSWRRMEAFFRAHLG